MPIHIPGSNLEVDLNPFDSDGKDVDPDSGQGRVMRLKEEGRKWDGKGVPPSRDAAIGYLLLHGHNLPQARQIVGESGTLTAVGGRVRRAVTTREAEHEKWLAKWKAAHPEATDEDAVAAALDDGKITEDELASLIEGGPGAAPEDTRGAPLWPFEGPAETLAELTVKEHSRSEIDQGERDGRRGRPWEGNTRVGARYYEQDTLEPLKWSAEQRADLQRVLQGIGLYGEDKIRLGSWSSKDQAIYAELLASANVEGLTWAEMLQKWKRNPPADLLDEIKKNGPAPLVVHHTDARDLEQTAKEVSRQKIGRVDRGFANSVAGPYQAIETQTQTAAYNAAETGGTVTDAPSASAFAADRLDRTNGVEVDSYSTLGAFNEVLRQLGLAG